MDTKSLYAKQETLDVINRWIAQLEKIEPPVYIIRDNEKYVLTPESITSYVAAIIEKIAKPHLIASKVAESVYPKLKEYNTVDEFKELVVACATEMIVYHNDYQYIATHIIMSDLHESTHSNYLLVAREMCNSHQKIKKYRKTPIVTLEFFKFVELYCDKLNAAIKYERDYNFTIFGYRTLEKAYLKKDHGGKIIERPQHMYMRVAIADHFRSDYPIQVRLDRIIETYNLLSGGYFTHATPTLFNAGSPFEQLASCFLMGIGDDMGQIGDCWKDTALISKNAGGIAIHVTNIRCDGAYIASTQGRASGLRVLPVFNQIGRYADQGGGKRKGSIAIYTELWNADCNYFLELKKNTGAETERARDLFLGLMVNDEFMYRVEADDVWSLMCPNDCPKLLNTYGEEFSRIYRKYESKGNFIKQIKARDLWFKILETQIETGTPYILFKDACNKKSNQQNIGCINSSNLCCEILEVSSADSYAVCNLASIALPKFVEIVDGKATFNYQKLMEVTRVITRNLDNIIDINYYPVEKTVQSNKDNRPLGIGIQGLADVFMLFKTAFDSELARDLNKKIFETIYYGAMLESMCLSKEHGPYKNYPGSPISKGRFQYNLAGLTEADLSGMWDFNELRENILLYGVRNSLTTAEMPTASTSQILGNNETIEPYTENIYSRYTLAGDYYIINHHLMRDLIELGLWDDDMIDLIKYKGGSVQEIDSIPDDIKLIYRTAWEIPQKSIIEMAADRGAFVDQSQSMNIFIKKPDFQRLTSCLFLGWRLGLKTGMYYLRSKSEPTNNQFGIDIEKIERLKNRTKIATVQEDFVCHNCSA